MCARYFGQASRLSNCISKFSCVLQIASSILIPMAGRFATLKVSMHRISVEKNSPCLISVVDSAVLMLIAIEDCIVYYAYRCR